VKTTADAKELTIVANNSGNGDYGLARLINSGRVRKVICSYPRSSDYSAFLKACQANSLELELVPQGTISERMRCHAAGLGGFRDQDDSGMTLEKLQTLTEPKLQLATGPGAGPRHGSRECAPDDRLREIGDRRHIYPGIASLIRATKAPLDEDSAQIYAPLSILL
jgi:hypothetical protein